ncbi:MAG: ACR3 family arsenite efflux transporter [Candidatus Planktophila sp.]|nr:ACR3 family arsenite efflux transporter [Candidatus Planktophila sp.]
MIEKVKLSTIDRFLPVWILGSMAIGLGLGKIFPNLNDSISTFQIEGTSLPIALGLFLMMYPVLAKVHYEELGQLRADKKLLISSLVLNWIIGPALMFVLAWLFLSDQPELRTGLIVIGLARCIAMVLIWNDLACGNREAAALLVAINSIFQILAYAILGTFYLRILPDLLGFDSLEVKFSTADISKAVLIFLGVPLLAGFVTRKWGIRRKGLNWYNSKFVPKISPFALYGLLFTIILMFALQGQAIVDSPSIVAQVALPLLIYFFTMWGFSYAFGKWIGMGYEKATTLAFTAAGNNFELAIAVSIGVWGITSGQALVGVIGPLIEVPALVALVYISLWLRRRY